MYAYYNMSNEDVVIKKHDVIGQLVFMSYLTVDEDKAEGVRTGGFGSTSK